MSEQYILICGKMNCKFIPEPVIETESGERLGSFYAPGFDFHSLSKDDETGNITAVYKKNGVVLSAEYRISDGAIEERITLANTASEDYHLSDRLCGFRITDTKDYRFCAIPFRRDSATGNLRDWTEEDFKNSDHKFPSMRNPIYNWVSSSNEFSEGFSIYGKEGFSLLTMKYAPEHIEFSVLSPDKEGMIFGGAAIGRLGDPEGAQCIKQGNCFSFGLTRYLACEKGLAGSFRAFRDYMDKQGHTVPEDYSPRFTWNELYDNPYWYERDKHPEQWQELIEKYYQRKDMMTAAENAFVHGCECLYLDPGWDTSFGSNIWDDGRMGNMKEFSAEIKEKFGLTLGLHTPLAPWSDNYSYDSSERRTQSDGSISHELCVMSEKYQQEKLERMKKLCENGADFFLYDGSWFSEPCFNPDHGHGVPSTRQEHIDAINRLAKELHKSFPKVTIEQHDAVIGPGTPRYLPLYTHMKAGTGDPDEIWSFEFMNDPLDDFKSGRAYSMYYANLAYRLPFYLHIDLRFDNEEGLTFWWFASTCRHLGIGGTDKDPAKRQKQIENALLYKKYSDYYKKGVFYGISELVHGHTLGNVSVLDFFNPTTEAAEKSITFLPSEIGLEGCRPVSLSVNVPAAGHAALILRENNGLITVKHMK